MKLMRIFGFAFSLAGLVLVCVSFQSQYAASDPASKDLRLMGGFLLLDVAALAGWASLYPRSADLGIWQVAILFCGYWTYFAAMESSPWEATMGKIALRLRVTDFDGHRITFAPPTGRYLGKITSLATFLMGFFIAMFTKRKQSLHGLFAKTLVLDA
jgi:uncharacterized RDD family membrane protein YckC